MSPEPVTVTVEYFAIFRSLARKSSETLTLEDPGLPALYESLRDRYGFPLERASVHVALNDAYASWDSRPRSGDRLAFIPPVSGG